jgi:hypothetical protein
MNKYLYFILLFFLYSCLSSFNEQDILGKYSPINYYNNFDTIIIAKNNKYYRKVYDINKKLVLDMSGEWYFTNDNKNIQFWSFYLNLDDDLVKFPESVKDTLGGSQVVIEKFNGNIKFCFGYFAQDLENQNCYEKLIK